MTKQVINISTAGNDGKGDTIRESFRKVNENFNELYATFGLGSMINFTSLGDAPSTYGSNQLIMSSNIGDVLTARNITAGLGISIDTSNDASITISSAAIGGYTANNNVLELLASMNAGGFSVINVADPSDALRIAFNNQNPGALQSDLSRFVIPKGYADANYVSIAGSTMTGALTLVGAPNADLEAATKKYVDDQLATQNQLSELTDVSILTTPNNGDVLIYSTTSSTWVSGSTISILPNATAGTSSTATLGVASFDSTNFVDNSAGWISLTDLSTGNVLGNFSGSTSKPGAVTASDVVTNGDGIQNASFTTSGAMTVASGAPNTYSVTSISTSGGNNSLIKTDNSGNVSIGSGNLTMGNVLKLTLSTTVPGTPAAGMIAIADGATWNPASKPGPTVLPYPVFYDGTGWNAFY